MKNSLHPVRSFALGLTACVAAANAQEIGALYTMDNAGAGNHVQVIARKGDTLSLAAAYPTGGLGLGSTPGLPSQGSLLLSPDGRWLFVCNAGSDDVSVFETLPGGGLQLTDKVPSGGRRPLSLALHGSLLYVVNAGGAVMDKDNVTAFHFGCGALALLPGSARPLSADNTGPAQVSISRDGETLVVTEKATGLIDTWLIASDGMAKDHQAFMSVGMTPYGFGIGRSERLFVSEAAGGAPNASSVSSYTIGESGALSVISAAVPTKQTAACWLALAPNGRYLYTGDAGGGAISGFHVHADGSVTLLEPSGLTASVGSGTHPADLAFSQDGSAFFSLNNGNGTISAFRVMGDGSLQSKGGLAGLPTSSAGLAAR